MSAAPRAKGRVAREHSRPRPRHARELISKHRFAEAYDLLYELLDAVIEPDFAARELAWICDRWDRVAEGNRLREKCNLPRTKQMELFEI